MSWDLEAARARLGIGDGDTSQDAAITACMAVALAAAESYCDRWFLLQEQTEDYRAPVGPSVLVKRYPLVSLDSLAPLAPAPPPDDPLSVPSTWAMDQRRGIVYLGGAPWGSVMPVGSIAWPACGGGFALTYTGGYDPLPADLEAALWMVFDNAWASTPGWGAAAGSGSAAGPVRSFGIDGMTISYDTTAAAAGGAGARAPGSWGLLPANAVGILDFYRADSAALGA